MLVFRAARLFGFPFAANTLLIALRDEIETYFPATLCLAPDTVRLACLAELEEYKQLAIQAMQVGVEHTPNEMWEFWRINMLQLPHFFASSTDIALIMTSSACVERIFSLYVGMFSDEMCNTLEDRREASVTCKFNNNQRYKEYG